MQQDHICMPLLHHACKHETVHLNEHKDFLKMQNNQGMQMLLNAASTYEKDECSLSTVGSMVWLLNREMFANMF
jgi:hypothetical protein